MTKIVYTKKLCYFILAKGQLLFQKGLYHCNQPFKSIIIRIQKQVRYLQHCYYNQMDDKLGPLMNIIITDSILLLKIWVISVTLC